MPVSRPRSRVSPVRVLLAPVIAAGLAAGVAGTAWAGPPGLGGASPVGPAPGGGGPGGRRDKKEGPAEEAPKDKEALRPIEPVAAQPERRRRIMLFDLHGYMRVRGDFFHRLNLGLADRLQNEAELLPNKYFRPPVEMGELDEEGQLRANDASCIRRLTDRGVSNVRADTRCQRRNGFPSANMRLRLEPTLHVTDTVKVHSQIDALDNVVLGSTPDTYAYGNPAAPLDLFTRTQVPPQGLQNNLDDSILVKRAWGHIRFGFGLDLQFGRMPNSWGMGMVANHGNGYYRGEQADIIRHLDRDFGDSVDRLRLAFDFGKDRRRTHTVALTWDWAATGATTAQVLGPEYQSGRLVGQTISAEKFDNVYQWSASVERRDEPEMLRRKLSLGSPVVNYGLITWLRFQDVDQAFGSPDDSGIYGQQLVARRALLATPDLWFRVNWRTLRVELEAAGNFGTFRIRDIDADIADPDTFFEGVTSEDLARRTVANFGYALEFKYGFFKDRFHIGLDQGFAMGDDSTAPFAPDNQAPVNLDDGNSTISNFRFNPAYNVDLLLFRETLGTISNAAYFKPWAAFYFFQHFSARADIMYALAAERGATLGNRFSYGIELDGAVRYHDAREPVFFQLQYGVLFPLGAFNRLNGDNAIPREEDARAVQTLQAQVGIRF